MWTVILLIAFSATVNSYHGLYNYRTYHAQRYDRRPTYSGHNYYGHHSYQTSESDESSEYNIGLHCYTKKGEHGICLRFSHCQGADKAAQMGIHHHFCYRSFPEPVICCPYYPTGLTPNGQNGQTTVSPNRNPNNTGWPQTGTTATTTTRRPGSSGETTPWVDDRADNGTRVRGTTVRPNIQTGGSQSTVGQGIAQIKCNEYINAAPQGPTFVPIVGGDPARPMEFPHMAVLGYGDEDNKQWLCGGSLISEQFILTAAHCLVAQGVGAVRWVRLGDLDLRSDDDIARPQEFRVVERIRHPNYTFTARYNDIALLRLDRQPVFDEFVYPSCLSTDLADTTGETPKALGWGRVEFEGDPSDVLLRVTLDWFSPEECSRTYRPGTRRLERGIESATQICAGSRRERKDTCSGDSGGPLIINRVGLVRNIVGITSFGKICGEPGIPGVYTRVQAFVPWIESIVWRLN